MISFFKTHIRRLLITTPVVVALVVVTVPLSGCGLTEMLKGDPKTAVQAPKPRVPTGAERFAAESDHLTSALDEAKGALAKGSEPATALADIRRFQKRLPTLDKAVQADFAKTREVLKKVDSLEKDAIEARVERQYASRVKTLSTHLSAITSAKGETELSTAITKACSWLDSVTPEEPYQPLGTELPNRIVDAKAGPPVLGTAIAPAYVPDTPGAIPSTLPVTPTEADTTETVEVVFTPEIRSLAASLGNDPVRIYEYVRNTIDFEPYYGSRKGATETLLEGSGNDIDTASLLIALYRVSGIPARYVSGVVDIPIDDAMNWVGVEVPTAAARLFASGGTPTTTLMSGGKPKYLRIEHTWAEVHVDYEDYRGASGSGTGEKIWVPLDASVKRYVDPEPVGFETSVIDVDAFTSVLASGAVETSSSMTKCDLNAARDALASATASLSASLEDTPTIEELLQARRIVRARAGVLPSSMPLCVNCVAGECASVPEGMQQRVSVSVPGGAVFTTPLSQVASQRITVSFRGATEADRDLVAAYGSIADVPAYQVEVRPRVSVNGELVSEGDVVRLGEAIDVSLASLCPGWTDAFTSQVTAGGVYSLVLDASRITPDEFSTHVERYRTQSNAIQAIASGGEANLDVDALAGELFLCAGLMYFMQLDAAYQALSGPWGTVSTHLFSEGTVGTSVGTTSLLGLTAHVAPTGVSLDVRRDSRVVVSAKDDALSKAGYFATVGGIGSSLEGVMIGQVFGLEGISTMRVLQIANNSSIPILSIDSGNAALIETLDYPDSLKSDLRAAVAEGDEIVIPKSAIDYYGYRGTGWIERDPDTGAAGYMIAGGLAGGQSTTNTAPSTMSMENLGWAGLEAGLSQILGWTLTVGVTIEQRVLAEQILKSADFLPYAVYALSFIGAMLSIDNAGSDLSPETAEELRAELKRATVYWLIGTAVMARFKKAYPALEYLGPTLLGFEATVYYGILFPLMVDCART